MSNDDNSETRYRIGLPPDAQHEYEAQRDAAGGSPNVYLAVPPAIGDIAYGGATNAATILHEAIEKLIPLLSEAGVAYQQVIVTGRLLGDAQRALDLAAGHREALETELETWGRRPRVGGVDPDDIHPQWRPTFTTDSSTSEPDERHSHTSTAAASPELEHTGPPESDPNPAEETRP